MTSGTFSGLSNSLIESRCPGSLGARVNAHGRQIQRKDLTDSSDSDQRKSVPEPLKNQKMDGLGQFQQAKELSYPGIRLKSREKSNTSSAGRLEKTAFGLAPTAQKD